MVNKNNLSETELDNWTAGDMKAGATSKPNLPQSGWPCHLPSDLSHPPVLSFSQKVSFTFI